MDKTPDSSVATKKIFELFLSRKIYFYKKFQNLDVHHAQLPILKFVTEHKGCTQREIANALHVSAPSVAMSTKRMQNTGLLMKKTDPENLRQNRLMATEKGELLSKQCRTIVNDFEHKLFENFSQQEIDALVTLLDKMIANSKNVMGETWPFGCCPDQSESF